MADEWARDFTNDVDWDAFMNPDSWEDMQSAAMAAEAGLAVLTSHTEPILQRAFEGGAVAPGPSSTAFGTLSGSQDFVCERFLREDLHSRRGHFGVGLEDSRNIEISKSILNAESIPRGQDSNLSRSEAGTEYAVSDRSEPTFHPDPAKCCTCITCQELGAYKMRSINSALNKKLKPYCIMGCKYIRSWETSPVHERGHFKTPSGYACAEQGCHFVNKKFTDLQRHYTSKHCTNPNAKNLECPEIGCEYKTARKDKLKEHQKCKHMGKPKPGKPYRVIKPAISSKPAFGASGVTAIE